MNVFDTKYYFLTANFFSPTWHNIYILSVWNISSNHKFLPASITRVLTYFLMPCYNPATLTFRRFDLDADRSHADWAVQNMICKVYWCAPVSSSMKSLHWFPIQFRIRFKVLVMVYKTYQWNSDLPKPCFHFVRTCEHSCFMKSPPALLSLSPLLVIFRLHALVSFLRKAEYSIDFS